MGWADEHLSEGVRRQIAEQLMGSTGGRIQDVPSKGELIGLCPLHDESNPSFAYNYRKDVYNCSSGCGGGDLVRLFGEINGLGKGAIKEFKAKYAADVDDGGRATPRSGRDRPAGGKTGGRASEPVLYVPESEWAKLPPLPEHQIQYLEAERGWTRQTIEALDLRLYLNTDNPERVKTSAKGRVAIPVRAADGRLYNIRMYQPKGSANKVMSYRMGLPKAKDKRTFGKTRLWPAECLGTQSEEGATRLRAGSVGSRIDPTPLWLCEGEPDVICARAQGLEAVTQTAGAKTWPHKFSEAFAGRDVIICYDADQPGRDGAAKAAESLARHAERVRIIKWPEFMAEGQDLTDWFMTHKRNVAGLKELLAAAEVIRPPDPQVEGADPWQYFSINAKGGMSFKPAKLAADILAEHQIVTDPETGLPYRWTGTHWERCPEARIRQAGLRKLGEEASKARASDAASQVVDLGLLPEGERMNLRPGLLCMKNGMVELSTFEVSPHAPEHRATYMAAWPFDPVRPDDCLAWKRFLREVVPERAQRFELQEFFGYCLWPDNRFETALFLIGPPACGKSTILNVLQAMIGEDNVSNVSVPGLEDQFQRVLIHDKMLNVFTEADARLYSSEFVKAIVSGDRISAAYKHRQGFEFRPRCKLAFSANRFPRVSDPSAAFYRRLMVIKFKKQFMGKKRDTGLIEKLTAELEGITNWAMAGLGYLVERGRFDLSRRTKGLVRGYRRDNNPVLAFIEERIEVHPDYAIAMDAMYVGYQEWCKKCNYRPLSYNPFFRELKASGLKFKKKHKSKKQEGHTLRWRQLVGIRLNIEQLELVGKRGAA